MNTSIGELTQLQRAILRQVSSSGRMAGTEVRAQHGEYSIETLARVVGELDAMGLIDVDGILHPAKPESLAAVTMYILPQDLAYVRTLLQ